MLRTLVIALFALVPVAGLAPGCSSESQSSKGQLITCDKGGNCTPTEDPNPAPGMCTDVDEDGDGTAHDADDTDDDGQADSADTDDDNDGTADSADSDDDNDGIADKDDCDEQEADDGSDD